MRHLTARWSRLATPAPPYPKPPLGATIGPLTIYTENIWFHYSTTGELRGPLLHAGGLEAARDRMHSLRDLHRDYSPEDFHTPLPTQWVPKFGADGTFALRLTRPVVNDRRSLITDDEAQAKTITAPTLYDNRYETGISVVAPLADFEIVGFMVDDTNLWTIRPRPATPASSLEVSKAFNLYQEQQRAYDAWEYEQEKAEQGEDEDEW